MDNTLVNDSNLKVLQCGDPYCLYGNSINSPDTDGDTGKFTSLALDINGNSVVGYMDNTNAGDDDPMVLHCGSPDCGTANVIASPDSVGTSGDWTSLALDGIGNPVMSYRAFSNLRILHCGDVNCTSGNVIASPDVAGDLTRWSWTT